MGVSRWTRRGLPARRFRTAIAELSLRGQGRPQDVKTADPASVSSAMQGDFQMADGIITLPAFMCTVPGATINLKGTYGVEGGVLNFTGTAKTEATASEMVGGWKGMLLKPVDHLFRKDGAGLEVPIHITGTREEPVLDLNLDQFKVTLRPEEKR